jgi:hypothetical protein
LVNVLVAVSVGDFDDDSVVPRSTRRRAIARYRMELTETYEFNLLRLGPKRRADGPRSIEGERLIGSDAAHIVRVAITDNELGSREFFGEGPDLGRALRRELGRTAREQAGVRKRVLLIDRNDGYE